MSMNCQQIIQMIERHNKSPQRRRVPNRNRIALSPRSWSNRPVVELELSGAYDGNRFIGDYQSATLMEWGSPVWEIDLVQRRWMFVCMRPNAIGSWRLRTFMPPGVYGSFNYASRWQHGYYTLSWRGPDHRLRRSLVSSQLPAPILQESPDGRSVTLLNPNPAVNVVLTPQAIRETRRLSRMWRRHLLELRPWLAMLTDEHPLVRQAEELFKTKIDLPTSEDAVSMEYIAHYLAAMAEYSYRVPSQAIYARDPALFETRVDESMRKLRRVYYNIHCAVPVE